MIKTLVIPVAGLGTRFLPATKAIPKEMLPIIDKPLIQYAVEEAMEAGITNIIFITNANKQAIETHFSRQHQLEAVLKTQENTQALDSIQQILDNHLTFHFIEQSQPLGLGHAILCAKPFINEPYFAVLLPDDLIDGGQQLGCLKQMILAFNQSANPMIAVAEVPYHKTHLYGIAQTKKTGDATLSRIVNLIEKPRHHPPSNLAVVGRYLLPHSIFDTLEVIPYDLKHELQLTEAIQQQLSQISYLSYPFAGQRFDCGSKIGFIKAMIHYATQHPELASEVNEYIENIRLQEPQDA